MITLLTGENSFEIDRTIKRIVAEFDGVPESFDGAELELRQLPDLLMGVGLFAKERLIIVRSLSDNKSLWDILPDWLERVSEDIHLILVEPKPDKRTKSYKVLQSVASVHEHSLWTERDLSLVEKWVYEQAKERGVNLTAPLVKLLVLRAGVDQWALSHAIDKLELAGEVSEDTITNLIDARPFENAFDLLEIALKGDRERLRIMIKTLALSEDPYQLFGLLSGQVFQLLTLAASQEGDNVARDIGAHPFALSRLKPYVKEYGLVGARRAIEAFTEADEAIKTSSADPWLSVERALLKVAE